MKHYVVSWVIDIEADTPEEAAIAALKIQRRSAKPDYIGNVFDVVEADKVKQPYTLFTLVKDHKVITVDLQELFPEFDEAGDPIQYEEGGPASSLYEFE